MLCLFMGPAACGKTSLLKYLCDHYDVCRPVVRVTTREKRPGEVDGKDYIFISVREFKSLLKKGLILEYEEYSGNRFYGTLTDSLQCADEIVLCSTITPSGLVQLCNSNKRFGKVLLMNCTCSIKNQILRYVNRLDVFTIEDKLEMCDRLARDEGMFKGVQSIIDLVRVSYEQENGKGSFECRYINLDNSLELCQDLVDRVIKLYL